MMIGWRIRRGREKVATLPTKRRLDRVVLVLVMGTSSIDRRRVRLFYRGMDGLDELIQAF